MHFAKVIQALVDEALPEWKDKYLPYKCLKKRLNSLISEFPTVPVLRDERFLHAADVEFPETRQETLLSGQGELLQGGIDVAVPAEGSSNHETAADQCMPNSKKSGRRPEERNPKRRRLVDSEFRQMLEVEFTRLLEEELNKLNDFVVNKEEDFVMKLQDLKEEVERLTDLIKANDKNHLDVINLQKDIVAFHGEMVLLINYSSLNYTGLVKIVKKHDRLTGAWLRLSFIPVVLRQPFYSTESLSRLVRECENNLLSVFPSCSGETIDGCSEEHTQEIADPLFNEEIINGLRRNTIAALETIQNMGKGSSTYNVFSVPPCEDNDDASSVVDEEIS